MFNWNLKLVYLLFNCTVVWTFQKINWLSISSSTRTPTLKFTLNSINKRDKNLEKVITDIDFKRNNNINQLTPLTEDPLYSLVKSCILAGNSRKAIDIKAFRISHLTEITSFMIILTGNSAPQNYAISNSIEVT